MDKPRLLLVDDDETFCNVFEHPFTFIQLCITNQQS